MRRLRNIAIGVVGSIVVIAGLVGWLLYSWPYAGMLLETRLSGTSPPQTFEEVRQAYIRRDYRTAFWGFRRLADAGDYTAMAWLARSYEYGYGVETNVPMALKLRRTAADHGIAGAEGGMGWDYSGRYYQDASEARYWFERAAQQGFALAQFDLAEIYERGWATGIPLWRHPPLKGEALKWYLIFSASDSVNLTPVYQEVSVRIARLMAQMSENEVAKARASAATWKATPAKSHLAITLPNALSALESEDYATASRLLRALADQGVPEAQLKLGKMHAEGLGQPWDLGQAMKWYRKAADQGFSPAQVAVGRLYDGARDRNPDEWPQDLAAAEHWYRKAAEQGDTKGMFWLSELFNSLHPRGQEGSMWLRRAAEKGDAIAQFMIGLRYKEGSSAPQDYVQAHKWFNLSAATQEGGLTGANMRRMATNSRDEIARKMTPSQIAEAQKLASEWKSK